MIQKFSKSKISMMSTFLLAMFIFCMTGFSQERFLMNSKERFAFKKATQYFTEGKILFDKENYKKSLKFFNKCLKQFPSHSDALFYKSQIQYKSGEFPEALGSIESAKKNFEKFAAIKTNTQLEYFANLRERKSKLESDLIDLKSRLANTNTTSSNIKSPLESTIDSLTNDLSLINERLKNQVPEVMKTPANYFYVHGNINIKFKKFSEAYDQFIKAVEADPEHGEALNNLATISYMAKKYKEALQFINMAESKKLKINEKLKEAIVNSLKKN
ncbi:MAG: tetratricopeptide repeat protein [Acidobacteriota bacterium]